VSGLIHATAPDGRTFFYFSKDVNYTQPNRFLFFESIVYFFRSSVGQQLIRNVATARNEPEEPTINQMRPVNNASQTSVKNLEEMEKVHFKPLIQRLINAKTTTELEELVIVFNDLANLLKKLGDLSEKLVHYTDAAIVYQYVLTILEEKLPDTSNRKKDTYAQLAELQRRIFSAIGGDFNKMPDVEAEANSYRMKLSKLREETRKDIMDPIIKCNDVRNDPYRAMPLQMPIVSHFMGRANQIKGPNIDSYLTRTLFEGIAKKMKSFLASLYNDSERQMAMQPPCSYAVIGLGSMALQQITPYSDLEFAILVENENFRSNADPKVRNYFENLSHLVHFKMIGLRETVIATSKYDVDTSHLVHVGVNFDLGGKTPLGRIAKDKPYSLIKTVDWMLEYVYNKEEKASHIDKCLPYILENVCFVYGNQDLVTTYQNKVAEFLGSRNDSDPMNRLNCEIRAIKLLEEGTTELDYFGETLNGKSREIAFKGDLKKLQPSGDYNKNEYLNVKQEIYRLPDRLIYNLGLLFNITGSSGWDTIDKLCVEQILNEQAAANLKRAFSYATLLRLRTYFYHQAQVERMSVLTKKSDLKLENFQLSTDEIRQNGELYQYYYVAIPLHKMLMSFCSQNLTHEEKRSFFRKSEFYREDPLNKKVVRSRLSQLLGRSIDTWESLSFSQSATSISEALFGVESMSPVVYDTVDSIRGYCRLLNIRPIPTAPFIGNLLPF
jgi:hypothetical protein